ncbi:NAD-dependent epimerase/dehydratase family protein [Desulfovibrio litoralis]|uniref:UDP-glucose 4-epimerase n=1 Tax=Desulfovibrio litoralis DSM 11393 TaxID=1121455 RepID=A0A1M7SXP2_9BACT|nr:NAD(P)-dependent oxidoreductase [Desulfovibrio litoralis]SHN63252.1 UDP-glucose 4-epimerase [Desulfovibrio litoralis DSM 11393]
MKIIVFGGSGFLGSHVADKLSDAGHEVTLFDIRPSLWLREDQKMIVGDILNEKTVNDAVAGCDAVYNFAGIADIGEAGSKPVDTVRFNVLGNAIILEAARLANVKRFVFASSLYVYSQSGGFYRCSKQASELFIENFYQVYGLEYTNLRYGSLYGPRADNRNAVYRFAREALEKGSITYYGRPNALREYIHIEDAARCSVEILEPEYANTNIVLTGTQPMRVGDLLKMIAEMLGKNIKIIDVLDASTQENTNKTDANELKIMFQGDGKSGHYEITPYSFNPRVGMKMTPRLTTDLGQGILRVIEEVHKDVNPQLQTVYGTLVKNK